MDSEPEKMQNESEKTVGGSSDYNMEEKTQEDKNDRNDAVRMDKTLAVDEINGQNDDAGKITGKKSGRKRKEHFFDEKWVQSEKIKISIN